MVYHDEVRGWGMRQGEVYPSEASDSCTGGHFMWMGSVGMPACSDSLQVCHAPGSEDTLAGSSGRWQELRAKISLPL